MARIVIYTVAVFFQMN